MINAVDDGLRFTGIELNDTPIHPHVVAATLARHRADPHGGPAVTNRLLLELTVNGRHHELVVDYRRTLVDALRHDLALTGTHVGKRLAMP